ncbi:MAG TPA: M20/M25/M40 family metallo-hydrolase, partial [Pyrinomonadaceae bacterium]|nr:M20/M25/M40 family metallo-hydrolase [Pyrinomonadaceae bacterium]
MKKLFRIFLLLLLLVAALLIYLVVNTFRHPSKQIGVQPAQDVSVDDGALASHLAQAIRFQTVSTSDPAQVKTEEFLNLHRFIEETYPNVHTKLTRELVADYSLLYTWKGSDQSLKPMLLAGHQDVVPIEPGTESRWTHPPFDGQIADGYVWGRGSLDDKCTMIGVLEAVEMLLREGYQPRRTIYLAFGHDEELGGPHGAPAIAELLRTRGVELESVLDEGGAITEGFIKGLSKPAALVGTGEKGFMSVQLSVETEGGHSSAPPPQTAVGIVSAAVARLEGNQMPARIDGATQAMLDYLGPEMNFPQRIALANLRLFRPLVLR